MMLNIPAIIISFCLGGVIGAFIAISIKETLIKEAALAITLTKVTQDWYGRNLDKFNDQDIEDLNLLLGKELSKFHQGK